MVLLHGALELLGTWVLLSLLFFVFWPPTFLPTVGLLVNGDALDRIYTLWRTHRSPLPFNPLVQCIGIIGNSLHYTSTYSIFA